MPSDGRVASRGRGSVIRRNERGLDNLCRATHTRVSIFSVVDVNRALQVAPGGAASLLMAKFIVTPGVWLWYQHDIRAICVRPCRCLGESADGFEPPGSACATFAFSAAEGAFSFFSFLTGGGAGLGGADSTLPMPPSPALKEGR